MSITKFTFPRPEAITNVRMVDCIADLDVSPDFLILDSEVEKIYGEILPVCSNVIVLQGGEADKTLSMLERLLLEMSRTGLRKDSRVVVVGGGTVCDIGAFAASTWKRGVHLTLVPTTLLCMVDASLGGKTAVNIRGEKNQAGTVYPASEIVICPAFLESLPPSEMKNGLAEAMKTAVIGDRQIVEYLLKKDYTRAVAACLAVKGRIVAADLEETGERRILNLGHTIGHCIEAASNLEISHGAAVAMGIPIAAQIAGNYGFAEEFSEIAGKLGIETEIPDTITLQNILAHLEGDKKTTASGRIWIIPEGWENCRQLLLDRTTEKELLEKVWQ